MFSYPVLVCDTGGTHMRFAAAMSQSGVPGKPVTLATADFASFESAMAQALAQLKLAPASMIACAAGPGNQHRIKLTNAALILDGPAIAERFELEQGLLLNDLEALALALPSLAPSAFRSIGGGGMPASAGENDIRAIIGVGTGLGAAALAPTGRRYVAIASEAGHVSLAPQGEIESEIFALAESECGRVSAETFLSGPGLARLHRLRLHVMERDRSRASIASPRNKTPLPPGLTQRAPQDIARVALQDAASAEAHSVRMFWRLMARFSGDLALMFLARGGLTLAGGVIQHLAP
ncbi:MAG: glucokinase, partial [Alphaproteobacteria bacterium]|nr:glucokinase [Alphaproteobacteria bacterium]